MSYIPAYAGMTIFIENNLVKPHKDNHFFNYANSF